MGRFGSLDEIGFVQDTNTNYDYQLDATSDSFRAVATLQAGLRCNNPEASHLQEHDEVDAPDEHAIEQEGAVQHVVRGCINI